MTSVNQVVLIRIFIVRDHGTELLVEHARPGARLPVLAIPSYTRPAEELTQAIERQWALKTYCLFLEVAELPSDPAICTAILEVYLPSAALPVGMEWVSALSLPRSYFCDPWSYATAGRALTTLEGYRSKQLAGPFGQPGWLGIVTEWVEAQAATIHLRLTHNFLQLNASPTFSLIRFETDGPNLWFKAVGEPNVREYPITLALAKSVPEYIPTVIAAHSDWNAWLAIEAEGTHLGADSTAEDWVTVINSLTNLQIAALGHARAVLEYGARDARPVVLDGLVDGFFEEAAVFLEEHQSICTDPFPRNEMLRLAGEIRRCLDLLQSCCLPNVLGHFDFSPTNILISGQRCVFLDWAEACIGTPTLTLVGALETFEACNNHSSEARRVLISQFIKGWSAFESTTAITQAIEVSPLIAPFARFVTSTAWKRRHQFATPNLGKSVKKCLRRMQRAFEPHSNRRIACLT